MKDLHELPKLRDSLSYIYVEHALVERDNHAIQLIDQTGRVRVPAAALCVLLLGPGTNITHGAMKVLAENGCSVVWVGEEGMRCYAHGLGETRKAYHTLKQAALASDAQCRARVVRRMYQKRFDVELDPELSLPQIRGLEGVRMRTAYAEASRTYGVAWEGRRYDFKNWNNSDPVNRALSAANALLNGICHAAIVSGGYSPAIGFIHTGRQLSFVYDIADLYKTEITIPIAFKTVSESCEQVDKRVRQACREKFREVKLLERILPDIDELLELKELDREEEEWIDPQQENPLPLWEALYDEAEVGK